MPALQLPSARSLLIEMRHSGATLGIGTGIVAGSRIGPVLITNRHNLTGCHQETGKVLSATGGVPNEVVIRHHAKLSLGNFYSVVQPLFSDGARRWFEHPSMGSRADIAALPLEVPDAIALHPYDLTDGPIKISNSAMPEVASVRISVGPADIVSVVGFPFGLKGAAGFPIWATGFVATEPEIDYDSEPVFLIDCRTRHGQSGSAVIAHRSPGMVAFEGGSMATMSSPITRLLGVYSGRINEQSDLGKVWKLSAVRQLVEAI